MERIAKEISVPVLINMIKGSRTPLVLINELERMGVKVVIYPNESQRASIWAVRACMDHLRDKGTTNGFDFMVDFSFREKLVERDRWEKLESKYLAESK
jgi:2-methylisocitrate lyase-like PEP mutase family enzyme